jgi:hypothetical protein
MINHLPIISWWIVWPHDYGKNDTFSNPLRTRHLRNLKLAFTGILKTEFHTQGWHATPFPLKMPAFNIHHLNTHIWENKTFQQKTPNIGISDVFWQKSQKIIIVLNSFWDVTKFFIIPTYVTNFFITFKGWKFKLEFINRNLIEYVICLNDETCPIQM